MGAILERAIACSPTWQAIRAGQRRPAELEEACALFLSWSGQPGPVSAALRRRLALRIGVGRTPHAAAARELAYALAQALSCWTAPRPWSGRLIGL